MKQQAFRFRTWGGKRRGAGRKPNGVRAGVSHLKRPTVGERTPVHVTVRTCAGVWNLRSRRCCEPLKEALAEGGDRFGFRLVHYSVQGNHVHFVVETESTESLSRGMQGL